MKLLETCRKYGERVRVLPPPNELSADARWLVASMPELLEHELPVSEVMRAIDGPLIITRTNPSPAPTGRPK